MKWYNKVFRNERNGKDTLINFDDLPHEVKDIIFCLSDGLFSGANSFHYYPDSHSDPLTIYVLRSHNSCICYVNDVPFCDVPSNVVSDFFFETNDEKGGFDEIAGTDEEHGTEEDQDNAAQLSVTDIEDERRIVYYDDHHIRLTREELELIKSALIYFSVYKNPDHLNSWELDYLLGLLDRVLGLGYDSSVVHLNDDSIPF